MVEERAPHGDHPVRQVLRTLDAHGGRVVDTGPRNPANDQRFGQVINEAAQMGRRDVVVWCAGAEGDAVERHLISDLLPHAFGPGELGID